MIGSTVAALFSGFTVVYILLCSSCAAGEVLECYQCFEAAGPSLRRPFPVCAQLKNSPKYKVACPNSTMCAKTVSTLTLLNGTKWTSQLRGCANQVNIVQVLRNRRFDDVAVVEEPYKDGCTEKADDNTLTTTVLDCFCWGNLCNSAKSRDLNISLKLMYAFFLLGSIRLLIE